MPNDIEEKMRQLSVDRYRSMKSKLVSANKESDSPYGRTLLAQLFERVNVVIKSWMKEAELGKPGKAKDCLRFLTPLGSQVVTALVLKETINRVSSDTPYSGFCNAIASAIEHELTLQHIETHHSDIYKRLERKMFKSRSREMQLNTLYAQFNKILDGVAIKQTIDKADKARLGSLLFELVEVATDGELFELYEEPLGSGKKRRLVRPSESLIQYIEKADDYLQLSRPFYLPTLNEPVVHSLESGSGGYELFPVQTSTKGPGESRFQASQLAVDAINAVQRTGWKINQTVLATAQELWKRLDTHGVIESAHPLPLPTLSDEDKKDKEKIRRYAYKKRVVINENYKNKRKRLKTAMTLKLSEEFKSYPSIYLPCKLDFRGRMYSVPFYINNQGSDLSKALLEFDISKPIKDRKAYEMYLVHGANTYGKDKETYEDRFKWSSENEDLIYLTGKAPLENLWWTEADSPWQFLAWCIDFVQYTDHGVSSVPCAVDGSAHGFQLWSLLLRDEETALKVNCVDTDKPSDLYSLLVETTNKYLMADGYHGTMIRWKLGLDRTWMKEPAMALLYGMSSDGLAHLLYSKLVEARVERGTLPWDEDWTAARTLAQAIESALEETLPRIYQGVQWLKAVAKCGAKKKSGVSWTLPSAASSTCHYNIHNIKQVQTRVYGKVLSCSFREETKRVDWTRQQRSVTANYTHSLDAALLHRTIVSASAEGITHFSMVHDSYGTHAADLPKIQQLVRNEAADIFSSSQLERNIAEWNEQFGPIPDPPPFGSLDPNEVRKARYFFH